MRWDEAGVGETVLIVSLDRDEHVSGSNPSLEYGFQRLNSIPTPGLFINEGALLLTFGTRPKWIN